MYTLRLSFLVAGGLVVLGTNSSPGQVLWREQGKPKPDVPDVVELVVDPAPAPRPALRYSLMPEYAKLRPGNGAPYYYRAILNAATERGHINTLPEADRKKYEEWYTWSELPDEEFPVDEARQLVQRYDTTFAELRTAAFREKCDWELRFRDLEGMRSISFLIGEFQECRELARLISIKARREIAEGRHAEAIETLQLGYRLGRDSSKVPILINDLVGISVGAMMRPEVERLLASPDSPNLYWAITAIPESYVDMRTSMQQEALLAEKVFPFLADADTADHSEDEWNRIIQLGVSQMDEVWGMARMSPPGENAGIGDAVSKVYAAAMLAKAYPQAKRRLVAAGRDAAEVDAMPVGRVIALDSQATFRYVRDEMFKSTLLPPHVAWREIRSAEKRLREEGYLGGNRSGVIGRDGGKAELIPIASTLLPAVSMAMVAPVRFERDLRALRIVEALRMHAAEHGRFPESLADVTAVPVPDNPLIDGPFGYRLDGEVAVLDVAEPEGFPKRGRARIYRLSIRKP